MGKVVIGRVHEIKNKTGISSGRLLKAELSKRTDPLTGLFDKEFARIKIDRFINNSIVDCGAVYLVDIDNLTILNNEVGQHEGDEIIKKVSLVIKEIFDKDDLIARVGGDKFLVFTRHCDSEAVVKKKSKLICDGVLGIYTINGKNISVSVGTSAFPRDDSSYEGLINKASVALACVKHNGKNGYMDYSSVTDECSKTVSFAALRYKNISLEDDGLMLERFGYEITDFAFKLMEETRDAESAINLLLKKVCEYYGYDVISIRECTERPRQLRYNYEYVKDDGEYIKRGMTVSYNKDEWDQYMNKFQRGAYIFIACDSIPFKDPLILNGVSMPETYIEIPIINQGRFSGSINFVSFTETKRPIETEINTMKMFARILSSYLLSMRDFNDTAILAEKLKERDGLTGLYKYDVFLKTLKKEVLKLRDDEAVALVYADIKNFRYINDTYGYTLGDKLLKTYSRFISQNIPGYLFATRVYSDNVLICVKFKASMSREENIREINRSIEHLSKVLQKNFMNRKITICSGIYIIEEKSEDIELCVSNANLARKEAKKSENSNIVIFNSDIRENLDYKIRLSSDLPQALENKEIKVYYQPKMESGTGKIVGGEALVRWKKEDGSFIYPDKFIPVFEENGLVIDVDYYVYNEVFEYIKRRIDKKKSVVPISLNVSSVHLQDEKFVDYVSGLFEKYGIPPRYIEFELTESIYIRNLEQALLLIGELKRLGVKIAMDDFGSGYSSLNVLNNLPIDVLKIDKVFLGDSKNNLFDSQKIIIKTIVEMATKLNMRVVCEGVENEEQNKFLTQVGCDMIQGYYYAKPMPEVDFSKFMDAHTKVNYKAIVFPFNGDMYDLNKKERVYYVGEKLTYCKGPFEGTKAIKLPGGPVGINLIDVPVSVYTNSSYSISCWARIEKVSMWSSLFFTMFEKGFNSIIPYAGDLRSDFRIVDRSSQTPWFDTGSSVSIDDGWHFYVATYNAFTGVSAFYIDDVIAGYREEVPFVNLPNRCTLGGDTFQDSLSGAIAKFSVYNQALSKTDIVDIYSKDKRNYDYGE